MQHKDPGAHPNGIEVCSFSWQEALQREQSDAHAEVGLGVIRVRL